MTVDMTLRIPDGLAPSIWVGAEAAGMSLNAYVARAARRQATLDAARLDMDKRLDLGLTLPRPRILADATDRPSTRTR
ncbi:hypothetical protein [Streptomyces sp. NPDC087859]|uniref:hypothetical protein n=1 Tax=Streptomyces sp. NPDC087859 TaxID=3365812 RepID=UPI00382C80E0